MKVLEGRVALITGAARGIGAATACRLAKSGATVVVNYLNHTADAEKVLACIRNESPASWALAADVRSPEAVGDMVTQVMAKHGKLDILVNNAGITRDGFFHKLSPEQWQDVLNTNLGGAYNACRAVVPHMRAAKYGRIINISSIIAVSGNMGQVNYGTSKAALIGFVKSLALESAGVGITVNAVAPGFTDTQMLQAVPEEGRQKVLARIPMGRFGHPNDIAEAVHFLASPSADYITGQVLHVNGGLYL